tara:strand:+ start:84 stop:851 length:768 start_codon:yes stop_codon:yes gene_type:complete
MALHKDMSGADLHEPKGKYPDFLDLEDDTANAYRIYEDGAGDDYLAIDTIDSSEAVKIGNTSTNPKLTQLGTGNVGLGTSAPDKKLEINAPSGGHLRLTHNDANGSAATYCDAEISSAGYFALKTSAAKGQSSLITKTVVQTDSTAGASTYTAAILMGGYLIRDPAGGDRSDVTPTAAQIAAVIPNAAVNDSFRFIIKNQADADETITLTAGTGVTITGTATIAQNNTKEWLCVLTNVGSGTEAATIYSLGTWTH